MYPSKSDWCHTLKADEVDQEQKSVYNEQPVLTFIYLMNNEECILNDAISEMTITICFGTMGIASQKEILHHPQVR